MDAGQAEDIDCKKQAYKNARLMPGVFVNACLASAVGDAPFAQIVGRQLYTHFVTGQNTDLILAHLAGDMRGYDVPVFQLHAKHGVGQGVDDSAFHFEAVFFRHAVKPSVYK
jgi:hypothetical protein